MWKRLLSWLARLLDPPVFIVAIEDGVARTAKGSPSPGFVSDCTDIARTFEIRSGSLYGHRTRAGTSLRFSPGIPEESHQRFRNVFGIHGGRMKS